MSTADKISNKTEELTGRSRKASVTLQTAVSSPRGRATKPRATLKQAGEKVKDAFRS